MKIHLLGLFAIIFASACVGFPGFEGGVVTTELPPDTIIVENVNTIPVPPINAGDQFSISFEIKNQDDINEVPDLDIQLFDYGLCNPQVSVFSPEGWVGTDVISLDLGSFVPGQTEFVEWTFRAPTNEQIGRLQTTCPIRFKTSYEFSATTQIDVQAISAERLRQLQRSGETPTFSPTQTIGRGPIKISFSFGASLPIRASDDSIDFDSILPVFITVEDKGQGLFGDVPANSLLIKVPSAFVVSSCDKFNAIGTEGTSTIYRNNARISMIKKKSPQLRCSFVVPDEDQVVVEKTYFLSANMTYVYDLTNEVNVDVKPTLAV